MSDNESTGANGPSAAVVECIQSMQAFKDQFPDWFDEYDDAMVDSGADRATIERLLRTAPNEFLRGMMFGKLAMRVQIAAITERAF
jgi:hypothetical protein